MRLADPGVTHRKRSTAGFIYSSPFYIFSASSINIHLPCLDQDAVCATNETSRLAQECSNAC